VFDYFGILVSIIFGLALTHLLRGIAKQLVMRGAVKTYWVHQLWTVNVVFVVLALWWGMYWWKGLQEWPAGWFFFLSLYAMVVFLWSAMLYPPELQEGFDFEQYFFRTRRRFFGLMTLAMALDVPETLGKQWWHLRPSATSYPLFITALILISIVGFLSSNRRVHAGLCVATFVLMVYYEFLTSLARIASHH